MDEDLDVQLSPLALAALQEFLQEKKQLEEKFEKLKEAAERDFVVPSMDLFAEDFQLSQVGVRGWDGVFVSFLNRRSALFETLRSNLLTPRCPPIVLVRRKNVRCPRHRAPQAGNEDRMHQRTQRIRQITRRFLKIPFFADEYPPVGRL